MTEKAVAEISAHVSDYIYGLDDALARMGDRSMRQQLDAFLRRADLGYYDPAAFARGLGWTHAQLGALLSNVRQPGTPTPDIEAYYLVNNPQMIQYARDLIMKIKPGADHNAARGIFGGIRLLSASSNWQDQLRGIRKKIIMVDHAVLLKDTEADELIVLGTMADCAILCPDPMDRPRSNPNAPPTGFNCRCTVSAINPLGQCVCP